jgi:hypothetical protein
MALGSNESLTEISTRSISWGEGGGEDGSCVQLTTLTRLCTECLEIWGLQPPGNLRACPGIAVLYILLYNEVKGVEKLSDILPVWAR